MPYPLSDQHTGYNAPHHDDPYRRSRGLHRNCILAPHGAEWSAALDRSGATPWPRKPRDPEDDAAVKTKDASSVRETDSASNHIDASSAANEKERPKNAQHAADAKSTSQSTPQRPSHSYPAVGKVGHFTSSLVHSSSSSKLYFGWR